MILSAIDHGSVPDAAGGDRLPRGVDPVLCESLVRRSTADTAVRYQVRRPTDSVTESHGCRPGVRSSSTDRRSPRRLPACRGPRRRSAALFDLHASVPLRLTLGTDSRSTESTPDLQASVKMVSNPKPCSGLRWVHPVGRSARPSKDDQVQSRRPAPTDPGHVRRGTSPTGG